MKGQSLQQLNTELFRNILEPVYTNNPMLRRNKRFFDTGILPLPEVANETHDSVDWGKPELDIEHAPEGVLNAVYYRYGIFIHYDWDHMFTEDGEFINPAPLHCPWFLKCKFGFIEDKEPVFCVGCNQSQYEDIEIVGFKSQFTMMYGDNSSSYFVEVEKGIGINKESKITSSDLDLSVREIRRIDSMLDG